MFDQKLLAVKVELEGWRHWLEGAAHPILIWADHKNLQYLKTAKRLNPRQARSVMFFARFDFVLSYRPVSKNQNPDSLSRIFSPGETKRKEAHIPPERVPGVTWDLESRMIEAQEHPCSSSSATEPVCSPKPQE